MPRWREDWRKHEQDGVGRGCQNPVSWRVSKLDKVVVASRPGLRILDISQNTDKMMCSWTDVSSRMLVGQHSGKSANLIRVPVEIAFTQ
jgi:hypothetical protein